MQVCPSAGQLARRIHLHRLRRTHNADQTALGLHFTASYTGTLRDMLAAHGFLCHSNSITTPLPTQFRPVYASCGSR